MNTQIQNIISEFESKSQFNAMLLDAVASIAIKAMPAIENAEEAESLAIDLALIRKVCIAVALND